MNQLIDPDSDARNALRLIGPDPQNWVPERAEVDHKVAITDFAAHERRIAGDVMPEFGKELYASALWRA